MKDTKKLIIKDKGYAIYKSSKPVLGGYYVVCDLKKRKAKNGLSLDSAYDLFKQLTLEATN